MKERLPAFCLQCGLIFDSRYKVVDSTHVTFSGCTQQCPRCGGTAEIPDGTFSFVGDVVEVLSATPLTRERLTQLVRLSPAEAEQQLASEFSGLEGLLGQLSPSARKVLIWFIVHVLLPALFAQAVAEVRDDSLTTEQMHQAVEQALEAQPVYRAP